MTHIADCQIATYDGTAAANLERMRGHWEAAVEKCVEALRLDPHNASAHSLGAVVCMAKPYRQERLGHVVRLLAPPPNANDDAMPPRPADPSRRHLGASNTTKSPSSNPNSRFRFGRKS